MVASQQEEVSRVLYLVGHQEADGLEGKLAAVDVVTQEKVVRLWRVFSVVEQPQQVGVLPMDIA